MGCFETKTYEEYDGGGNRQQRRNNENQNYQDEYSNFEEEEFEDFKELGSKFNVSIIIIKFNLIFRW